MSDKRLHERLPLTVQVKIMHPDIGEKIVTTRNISDGGIFLIAEPVDMPRVGEEILAQVLGMADDPPLVKMKIVRYEEEGIGLQFADSSFLKSS